MRPGSRSVVGGARRHLALHDPTANRGSGDEDPRSFSPRSHQDPGIHKEPVYLGFGLWTNRPSADSEEILQDALSKRILVVPGFRQKRLEELFRGLHEA